MSSAFGGEGPPGSLHRLDGPSPPKAELMWVQGRALALPSSPTHPILAVFR